MTDLRQAAQQALEALEGWEHCDAWVWPVSALEQSKRNTTESLAALRAALEQQAEPPPEWPLIKNILAVFGLDAIAFVAEWKAAQQQVEPTCPDCKAAVLYECVACSSSNYPPKQQAEPVAWQPIETAPKDGNAILVMRDIWPGTKSGRAEECNGHNTYVAAWWGDENNGRGAWVCYMDSVCEPQCPIEPTHWMPLPCPPSIAPPQQQAEPVAREGFNAWWDGDYDDSENRFEKDSAAYWAWAGWQAAQRPWVGLTDEEILSTDPWEILRADPWMGTSDSNINPYQILLKVRTLEAKLKERNT